MYAEPDVLETARKAGPPPEEQAFNKARVAVGLPWNQCCTPLSWDPICCPKARAEIDAGTARFESRPAPSLYQRRIQMARNRRISDVPVCCRFDSWDEMCCVEARRAQDTFFNERAVALQRQQEAEQPQVQAEAEQPQGHPEARHIVTDDR